MEEAERQASPIKKALMQWAKNAASHRQKLILEGKATHQDKGSLNYRLANKLVLRYVSSTTKFDILCCPESLNTPYFTFSSYVVKFTVLLDYKIRFQPIHREHVVQLQRVRQQKIISIPQDSFCLMFMAVQRPQVLRLLTQNYVRIFIYTFMN